MLLLLDMLQPDGYARMLSSCDAGHQCCICCMHKLPCPWAAVSRQALSSVQQAPCISCCSISILKFWTVFLDNFSFLVWTAAAAVPAGAIVMYHLVQFPFYVALPAGDAEATILCRSGPGIDRNSFVAAGCSAATKPTFLAAIQHVLVE